MAKEFRLPDIGEGLTEAEVVRWLVPVGGSVKADQPVVEVETDKAVVEIPSPFAGVVLHHGASEGQVVAVGSVLVVVGESGEEWPPPVSAAPPPIVGSLSNTAEQLSRRETTLVAHMGKVQALPLVRKLAKELGVELETLQGSGDAGRITREDVLAAARTGGTDHDRLVGAAPGPEEVLPAARVGDGDERRTLSKLRRTIAANMARSWRDIPHVTTFEAADGTRLLAARRSLEARHGTKIPLEALLIKAVIPALASFPEFNASLDGDDLVLRHRYDIGVAVDTSDGLLVAVAKSADRSRLLELSTEITRLAAAAKERTLRPDELAGQTFTISNIGAVGGGYGTPIIPPGTTSILSVGRARPEAVVHDGRIESAPLLPLSLSYDHRVVDGALGRRFIALVIENLEEPALFLAG